VAIQIMGSVAMKEFPQSEFPDLYTAQQMREAVAAEIISIMDLCKETGDPAIRKFGRELAIRVQAVMDAKQVLSPDAHQLKQIGEMSKRSKK
jgi:hypothetical protein